MHELSNFHPSRRRLAAAVFDFDCASVHLLARFKVSLLSITETDAGQISTSRAVRRA